MEQATTIEELLRLPSPAPVPQALTCDGDHLWMGSWDTERIYGIDRQHFTVFEERNAPGKPVGMVSVGDELRVVVSEGGDDDHRFIRRYVPGHGFKAHERLACPDDTGSFIAFDGTNVWLSQRYKQRVLELDAEGNVLTEVHAPAQILGIVWVDEALFFSLWHGRDKGGCRLGRWARGGSIEEIATLPFGAVSLTHDGTRFWANQPSKNEIVAFTF
jgi:hypothetical protein